MFNGDPHRALDLFEHALDLFHQSGNVVATAITISGLAATFYRLQWPDIAAILLGAAARHPIQVDPDTVEWLRATLGDATYNHNFATGAALDLPEATRFARDNIEAARHELNAS